jgi:protein involved in polysaccharide export with SLBB domain
MSQDPYLKDGDIITLERVDRRVTISGAVERPGTYELKKGENLKALIEYYGGGLDILANTDNITLSRTLSDISRSGEVQYLDSDVLYTDFELKHLDSVSIGSIASLKKTIFIQGAVGVSISETVSGSAATNNISYQFETGETYNHFVKSHKTWFTDVSDYERTYVSRQDQKISIDLYSMLFDPEYENDLELEADDILVVPFKQYFVTVSGAVKVPGRYAYVPDRTWDYYVGLAGGFDAELNSGDAVKITNNYGKTVKKTAYITPETTIDALKNSFSYKFNKVVTPLMSILSVITSTIVLINYFSR